VQRDDGAHPWRLSTADAHRLAEALERTEVARMLRPSFQIRTAIEHGGDVLNRVSRCGR